MSIDLKIGHGYDVHRLVTGRKLILSGVDIPHTLGLLGHSDADVLTHAVMDAVIGALGLGDIGRHFPDSDDKYKDISSMKLAGETYKILTDNGYTIGNIDCTVVAQRPKLAPYIEQMKKNLAEVYNIPINYVNIKATTEEGLGFTGSGEGIAAHAVVIIKGCN